MDNHKELLVDLLRVEGVNAKGYGTVPKAVMKDSRLTLTAKAIYAYFCSYAGAGNRVFPSRNTILNDLGIQQVTYYKHFKLLKNCDYIRVEQVRNNGKFLHNIYTLVPCPMVNDEPEPPCIKKCSTVKRRTVKSSTVKYGTNNINNKQKHIEQNQSYQSGIDRWDDYMEAVKKNIEYETLAGGNSEKMLDSILHLIVETLCSSAECFKINGTDMDAGIVKERLLQLDYSDIACILNTDFPEDIRNPKSYLLTVLFNAPVSSELYWQGEIKSVTRRYHEQKGSGKWTPPQQIDPLEDG
jgi:hypothetical protein